ncbi:MAG: hypothetical protein HOI33_00900 [Rhodospirillaceae bacterium]|nr:hypothetical protein [Rhodospirillaceae bacterium]
MFSSTLHKLVTAPLIKPARCILLVAFLLVGCGEGERSYFPFNENMVWGYRITILGHIINLEDHRSYITNFAVVDSGDDPALIRMRHDGELFFYGETDKGLRLIGQGKNATPPTSLAYVFAYPAAEGTTWNRKEKTFLLERRFRVQQVPVSVEIDMAYRIEATNDTVSVPAGTFTDCVRIRGEGKVEHYISNEFGTIHIAVEDVSWYAPGVGLVKTTRKEISPEETGIDGEYIKELEFFDDGSWLWS